MIALIAGIQIINTPETGFKARLIGGLSDRGVTFKVINTKSKGLVEEFTANTVNGQIDTSFAIKAKGKYRIRISSFGMLTHAFLLELTPGQPVNLGDINAFLGDVNGDNRVDQKDLSLIKSFLGVKSTSPVWIAGYEKSECPGSDCDLNADDVVDKKDFQIAYDNLGKRGSLR